MKKIQINSPVPPSEVGEVSKTVSHPQRTAPKLHSQAMANMMPAASPTEAVLFDNLNLMQVSEFCERFGYSRKTVYEWKYRPKRNKVPTELVVKFRGRLFIRIDILKSLIPQHLAS